MPRLSVRLRSHIQQLVTPALAMLLATATPALAQSAGAAANGVVSDAQGAVITRVVIRLIDARKKEVRSTLTDEKGRFEISTTRCEGCQVEATLTGFTTATAAPGKDLKLVLQAAPIKESVIVSATRDEAPGSQVGATTTVIDSAAIERRGSPLVSDLLRDVPGLTVVRNGGMGGVTSLFARGGESNYNKVLLDGIPMNEPGGTFDFSNLTAANLDRVEIVRGAQSALFGSDAMSSVVNLVTKRAKPGSKTTGSANMEFGSYKTAKGGAEVQGAAGKLDYAVYGGGNTTDNRFAHNGFNAGTISWNTGAEVAPGWSVRTVGRFEGSKAGTPGQTAFAPTDPDFTFDRKDLTAGAVVEQVRGMFKGRLTYAYSRTDQEANNVAAQPFTPAFGANVGTFTFFNSPLHTENTIGRHRLSYQGDFRLGSAGKFAAEQILTGVVDFDAERGTLADLLAASSVKASRNNTGVAVQYQAISSWLAVTAGVRAEDNASFGTVAVPRVSVATTLRHGTEMVGATKITFNAGLGVKEPTILQSFSPNFFFEGNPALLPERARTIDAGVEQRFSKDRAKVQVVYFDNRYRNQVGLVTIDFTTFESQYQNIGLTTARGVELATEVAPTAELRIGGGYTLTDSKIVASTNSFSAVFAVGQPALRRPRHSGFVQATWTHQQVGIDVIGTFVGRRSDSDFAGLTTPINSDEPYAVWTLGGHYRPTAKLDVYARVENLTNKNYMEPLGYFAWGRTGSVGVRVKF